MSFGNFSQEDSQPMAEINTTPLVDVMLVLLVVFMVTMPLITHSIPLDLPQSSTKTETLEQKEPMRISVNDKGEFYIGATQMSQEQLNAALKAAATKDKNTIVAIAADKRVEYKYVAQLLGMTQEAGLSRVGFVTEAE